MTYDLKRGVLLLPLWHQPFSPHASPRARTTNSRPKTSSCSSRTRRCRRRLPPEGADLPSARSDQIHRQQRSAIPIGRLADERSGKQIISTMAAKLAPTQQNKILVSGYTDNKPVGPALGRQGITSNQDLSQNRAENVMAFLTSQGVKPDLFSARGFGEADPVASNDTPQGRAQNRRVELSVSASGC
ncbi:MAG: OmpA family protein [Alphaproteobacteria bacterium]|nr:OmpA family protein [Alphaproteobacteria bacterium]